MTPHIRRIASVLAAVLVAVTASLSHAEAKKKVVTMADYGLWRIVSSAALSNDGNWMTYDYRKPEAHEDASDERKLQIKNLTSDRIDQTMVAAITNVGNAMGICTVAEHVDSRRVLETLVSIGVQFAQGYFIAEPTPVSEFPPVVGRSKVAKLKLA